MFLVILRGGGLSLKLNNRLCNRYCKNIVCELETNANFKICFMFSICLIKLWNKNIAGTCFWYINGLIHSIYEKYLRNLRGYITEASTGNCKNNDLLNISTNYLQYPFDLVVLHKNKEWLIEIFWYYISITHSLLL